MVRGAGEGAGAGGRLRRGAAATSGQPPSGIDDGGRGSPPSLMYVRRFSPVSFLGSSFLRARQCCLDVAGMSLPPGGDGRRGNGAGAVRAKSIASGGVWVYWRATGAPRIF